jgi:hypothetical protein
VSTPVAVACYMLAIFIRGEIFYVFTCSSEFVYFIFGDDVNPETVSEKCFHRLRKRLIERCDHISDEVGLCNRIHILIFFTFFGQSQNVKSLLNWQKVDCALLSQAVFDAKFQGKDPQPRKNAFHGILPQTCPEGLSPFRN